MLNWIDKFILKYHAYLMVFLGVFLIKKPLESMETFIIATGFVLVFWGIDRIKNKQ